MIALALMATVLQSASSQSVFANPVAEILVGAALALVGQLLWRVRKRRASIRWTATWTPVAISSATKYGQIEVLYQGERVDRVHLGLLRIRNDSARDLTDARFVFGFSDTTNIAYSVAQVEGSLVELPFTPSFIESWKGATDSGNLQQTMHYWKWRDYTVPALNRGCVLVVAVLTVGLNAAAPAFALSCESPGVIMRHERHHTVAITSEFFAAVIIGALLTLATTILLIRAPWASVITLPLAWLLGFGATTAGLALARAVRWVGRQL
jgi:hypothetical protein